MTRAFRAGDPTGVQVCGGSISGSGDGSTHSRFNWCLDGAATPTSAGHDLSLAVCRDQTGDSRLDFADGREVDLEVRQGDRVVWRWSASQAASGAPHSLPGPSGSCWSWTTAWTDVDGSGHRVPAGDYELVGMSTAAQLSDYPTSTGVVFHVT